MPDFGNAERRILNYFKPKTQFIFKGEKFTVINSGKPTCTHGEPKTDIYILAQSQSHQEEIKISYKKKNADFLENKINCERAEQLFGADWRNFIESATKSIKSKFEERPVIYKKKRGRVEKGSITLGWKFELLNKPGGDLSGRMVLTTGQINDIYSGANLSIDKKNASVNKHIIRNSGIANYILVVDKVNSAQDVIEQMMSINKYIEQNSDIYFACKALNYRTFEERYDGNRPLSVQVNWAINNGKLTHELTFNHPLEWNGDKIANNLIECLHNLDVKTTDDLNQDNTDMKNVNQ